MCKVEITSCGNVSTVQVDDVHIGEVFCNDLENLKQIVEMAFLNGYNKATQDTIDELKRMEARGN